MVQQKTIFYNIFLELEWLPANNNSASPVMGSQMAPAEIVSVDVFTVGRVVGHVGRHLGPVPGVAGPAAAAQPAARAHAVPAHGAETRARGGRAHAAAHALAAAHAPARAHSAAVRHYAHEGTATYYQAHLPKVTFTPS